MPHPRHILASLGLAAAKSRGQNFLVDPGRAQAIVAATGIGPNDTVVEIGPGLGALTRPLLATGARVVAVEIDRGLIRYLEENLLPDYSENLTLRHLDALTIDYARIASTSAESLVVIGNLPYLISTPILFHLLDNRLWIRQAVLMFQTELADRLLAGPGSKTYGRISVLLQYYADLTKVMHLGPADFHPRPQVGSTVLKITFKTHPRPELNHPDLFPRVIAAAFGQRRKTLRKALSAAFPPPQVEAALRQIGLDPTRRAETLSVEEYVALANAWG